MIHIVTYDMHEPDYDYEPLIKEIKSYGAWAHLEGSVWLVDTTESVGVCRDRLVAIDQNTTIFVARLNGSWASNNLDQERVDWLKSSNRTW